MKVITGKDTRWLYANVWEAKSINGGTPKFSVSLIIPKSDTTTIEKIKAAIKAAYEEGQAKLKGNGRSVPPLTAIKTPLRDGDTERPDDPAYADSWFINANSSTAPGIVDADCNPILTRSEVYSSVYTGSADFAFCQRKLHGAEKQTRPSAPAERFYNHRQDVQRLRNRHGISPLHGGCVSILRNGGMTNGNNRS